MVLRAQQSGKNCWLRTDRSHPARIVLVWSLLTVSRTHVLRALSGLMLMRLAQDCKFEWPPFARTAADCDHHHEGRDADDDPAS